MRRVGLVVVLTSIWVLLWGSLSVANVASGLVLSTVLLFVLPGGSRRQDRRPVIRPLAVLRLAGHVVANLAVSNVVLAREVLTPRSRVSTGVLAVPVPGCSDEVLTLLANLMALAPGTIPVETRHDSDDIYVHVLHVGDIEDVRRRLERLRDLTMAAFGSSPEPIASGRST
jgi:multicomponent Na+:H+ antiporter subunit E